MYHLPLLRHRQQSAPRARDGGAGTRALGGDGDCAGAAGRRISATVALEPIAGEACTTHGLRVEARSDSAPAPLRAAAAHASGRPVGCRAHLGGAVRGRVRAGRVGRAGAARASCRRRFRTSCKSYPPPFSYFERSVMRRAAGWIAFGETVHEAQAAKPIYAARPSRVIPPGVDVQPLPARRAARARRADAARLGRRHAGRRLSRPLRSGQGARRADAGARRRPRSRGARSSSAAVRWHAELSAFARRASRPRARARPMSATTTCPSI